MRQTIIPAILTLALFAGCAGNTHIVDSWQASDMEVTPGQYQRIMAVAMLQDERDRRKAEDRLTGLLPGHAVPSYQVFERLPGQVDEQHVMEQLTGEGFDAMLIMRLVRVEDDSTYVGSTAYSPYFMDQGRVISSPTYVHGTYPSHYGGVWSYYSHAYPYYNSYYGEPGYFDVDRYYYYEVNLYDLANDQLIWSSITSTYEPTDISTTTEEVVDAVHSEMVERGFVRAEGATTAR